MSDTEKLFDSVEVPDHDMFPQEAVSAGGT